MRILPEVLTSDSRILVAPDGTEIYADAIGDRSKPAVVFIHEFSLSTVVFDEIFNDPLWSSQAYLVSFFVTFSLGNIIDSDQRLDTMFVVTVEVANPYTKTLGNLNAWRKILILSSRLFI
jgi:hypothetical protein